MGLQTFSSALLAGVATAIATAFIGADIVAGVVDTSVAVGIPIGLIAGGILAGIVLTTSGENPARAALIASATLGFAAGVLVTYVGLTRLLGWETLTSVGAGIGVGAFFGILAIVKDR